MSLEPATPKAPLNVPSALVSRWLVVLAAIGCQQNTSSPAPTPVPVPTPALDAGVTSVPIEKLWGLIPQPYPKAKWDCSISSVVRRRFAGTSVKPCGVFPRRETTELEAQDDTKARTCIEAALAAKQPFVVEKEVHGEDSQVAHALVGVLEKAKLVMYVFSYDSNPCGGGCPERGHTIVERCESFALSDPACPSSSLFNCLECKPATLVDDCIFGPLVSDCVVDPKAQQLCDAKGPTFSYRAQRSKYCEGIDHTSAQALAESKQLLKRPCACLEVVAEWQWSEHCLKGNEAVR
jgi:hypothetical protein